MVYTMASSGIRLGAWKYHKWKQVIPIRDENDPYVIKAAKLVVYAGEPEQYHIFIAFEEFNALEQWMDLRIRHGENITGNHGFYETFWKHETKDMVI